MKLQGHVTWVSEITSGTSARGNAWQKRQFELQYIDGQYPKSILLDTLDEKIIPHLAIGLRLEVNFDFEVKEYNGRKYNDIRIWKDGIHSLASAAQPTQPQPTPQPAPAQPAGDALPF